MLAEVHGSRLEGELGIDASADAFMLTDAILGSTLQEAIGANGARAAAVTPELADLVRMEQDALKQIEALKASLSNVLAAPQDQQDPKAIRDLKDAIDSLTNARAILLDEIKTRFPKYSDLINPKPLTVAQVQKHLRPSEAFISIYPGRNRTYVWAIPFKGEVTFTTSLLGKSEMNRIVAHLRKALDLKPYMFGDIPQFDLDQAYELYSKLLKPVKDGWKDAKDLLVVAPGPLGQLPFSILPTELVKLDREKGELFANYRRIPWLIRKVSITRLPSISSFVTLRTVPQGGSARKAFVGFGDPYFNLNQLAQAEAEKVTHKTMLASVENRLHVRGLRITEAGTLDSDKITSSHLGLLNRLPDTAEEINSIAQALEADPVRDIFFLLPYTFCNLLIKMEYITFTREFIHFEQC